MLINGFYLAPKIIHAQQVGLCSLMAVFNYIATFLQNTSDKKKILRNFVLYKHSSNFSLCYLFFHDKINYFIK